MRLELELQRCENNGVKTAMVLLDRSLVAADEKMRRTVQQLITSSFAPHLDSFIEAAVNVASAEDRRDVETVFMHPQFKTEVDLSSCQVWSRRAGEKFRNRIGWMDDTNLLSTVIWRVIDGWQGMEGTKDFEAVPAGPILEVLFLATPPYIRRSGEAARLRQALERSAASMGCVAMCVAAVPIQGMAFWTQMSGYSTLVALNEEKHDDRDIFCEPVNELGRFLFDNMVLFTDTPLVAKILSQDEDKEKPAAGGGGGKAYRPRRS